MKILLLTLEFPPFAGGVANYYENLEKYWPREDSFRVIDNNKGELVSSKLPFSWLKVIGLIFKEYRKKSFDHLVVGHILPLGTATYFVSLFKPISYSVILHGYDFSASQLIARKRFLSKRILKGASNIICANSYVANLVSSLSIDFKSKIIIQNPGIDTNISPARDEDVENIKESYNLDNSFNILSLGRLVIRKGFDRMIESLAEIDDKSIKYFIAGSGKEEAYLKNLAKNLKISSQLIFLGSLNDREKQAWLSACDIFAMPARQIGPDYEGFGIVYLEANLAGKAVIAGRSGGVSDAVLDGENGLMVDPDNIYEIKEAILKLKNNKDLRDDMGNKGRLRASSEFNWEYQVKSLRDKIKI